MSSTQSLECHIICVVRSQPTAREQVKALLLELIEPARQEDGCLYYHLYEKSDAPSTFYIVDGWVSDEAIAAHGEHPNVIRVVEQLTPLLAEPLELIKNRRLSPFA